ncbi:epimerase [Acidovorax sp. GW101-3H11]|uniref:NAD-dependent epimerase/dehydratase family protein n=1 Tax=Acidovorax sp. GW101-3H11 TaxID=1813946 RepID=UPI0007B4F8CE|nr:NAD-dependent epimerase/dehydratase family protein [Acidovorax sp. GW101-3H11]KZT14020.1 epimerase [Acidovorax sp. GW101-3H11]
MTSSPLSQPAAHSPRTVLILGARGRLGLAAARAFAQAGWQVLAQVRPASHGAAGTGGMALPAIPGVWWMPVAVHETAALAAQAQGAQVVVHALNPPYTDQAWRTQAPALMEAAIAVARQLGATLMLPGNVYNFGEAMPAVLHEDTPQAATGTKGRLRVQLEQRLQAATQDGSLRAVVLRAGDFFGSGAGGLLDQVIAKRLPQGRVTLPGPAHVATPWAYLPDLARTFVRVAEQRQHLAAFDTLHFAGHHATGQQWVQALAAVAATQGWLPPAGALRVGATPWPLLQVVGLLVPMLQAVASMRYLWRTPHRLDNTRLTALIGDEPHTPFDTAVRQALADLGWARAAPAQVAAA